MSKAWIIGVVVLVMSGVWLVVQATTTKTAIVYTPQQLAESSRSIERVRVAGKVSSKIPVNYQHDPHAELRFGIENPGTGSEVAVPVVYRGVRPDMFAVGRDVIMDGELREGTFQASNLMTQCPSKYEPPTTGTNN